MRWRRPIKNEWHDWFAWRPVGTIDGSSNHKIVVWLERIQRVRRWQLMEGPRPWCRYQYRLIDETVLAQLRQPTPPITPPEDFPEGRMRQLQQLVQQITAQRWTNTP